MKKIIFTDKETSCIIKLYANRKSSYEIAQSIGYSVSTIIRLLKKNNVYLRNTKENLTGRFSSLQKVFWDKVNKQNIHDCWEWQGCTQHQGYGVAHYRGKQIPAHRLSYIINKGAINKKLLVCHKCDNTGCVNPEHLFLGTPQDNSSDMVSKNRHCCGEKNSQAKLKKEDVLDIRSMNKKGVPDSEIAQLFSISIHYVPDIIKKKRWAHI